MTKLKVEKFYHYKIKSAKIFASKSLKTLLKNASSKFLKSLVRIRSHAVLYSFCIVSIAFLQKPFFFVLFLLVCLSFKLLNPGILSVTCKQVVLAFVFSFFFYESFLCTFRPTKIIILLCDQFALLKNGWLWFVILTCWFPLVELRPFEQLKADLMEWLQGVLTKDKPAVGVCDDGPLKTLLSP